MMCCTTVKCLLKCVSMKLPLGLIAAIVLICAGFFVLWPKPAPSNSVDNVSPSSNADTSAIDTTELVIGNPDSKATIIEYADYKCPSCGEFHQKAGKQLRTDYVDKGHLKIVFRPFPVYSIDGAQALIGSYCAKDQNKFTEYHDAVFDYMWVNHFRHGDHQKAIDIVLTETVMNSIMNEIGMDTGAYKQCMKSQKHEKVYYDTIELAAPDDIRGTPSFIVNGQKVVGPQPYSVFKTLVDIQLQ
jgi:protein-disulfide isomerase